MDKKEIFSKVVLGFLTLIFLGISILPIIENGRYIFTGKAQDINKLMYEDCFEEYVDKYISADLDAIVDIYAETTHTYNYIPTGKDNHYIAWLEDDSFISITLKNKKQIEEAERVIDETWDYLDEKTDNFTENPLHIEGVLKELDNDLEKYYQEVLTEYGVEENEFIIRHYTIDVSQSRLKSIMFSLVALTIAMFIFYSGFLANNTKNNNILVNKETNYQDPLDQ